MAQSPWQEKKQRKAMAFSLWLYRLFLYAYPTRFRSLYGERMVRVFCDACSATLQQHHLFSFLFFWLHIGSDLTLTACLERWHDFKEKGNSMATSGHSQHSLFRLKLALTTTLIAFVVSLIASLNLSMIEDTSPLTRAAYSASVLLRLSYDGVYLTALAAGASVCAIVGFALVQRRLFVSIGVGMVTLLVALGGFGGLLVHQALTFLVFLLVFLALTVGGLLLGRAVSNNAIHTLGPRPAAVLGACVSTGCIVLINVLALVLHTLVLNPVSHELYMQGQIGGTSLNFSLVAMVVAFLTLIVCIICLGRALRLPSVHT
ncbi:MAG TPA: hypothetical protein VFN35_03580 [Ktedonobacteraceae bacterium]|nr:hypothetical protein [Ktedonobacteraceae bacterium]